MKDTYILAIESSCDETSVSIIKNGCDEIGTVVLSQMEMIGKIEGADEVEPMTFPYELENVELRDDSVSRNIELEEALRNSGSVKGREVKVPKVVE